MLTRTLTHSCIRRVPPSSRHSGTRKVRSQASRSARPLCPRTCMRARELLTPTMQTSTTLRVPPTFGYLKRRGPLPEPIRPQNTATLERSSQRTPWLYLVRLLPSWHRPSLPSRRGRSPVQPLLQAHRLSSTEARRLPKHPRQNLAPTPTATAALQGPAEGRTTGPTRTHTSSTEQARA